MLPPQELPKRNKVGRRWRLQVQAGKSQAQSGQPAVMSPSASTALGGGGVYGSMKNEERSFDTFL